MRTFLRAHWKAVVAIIVPILLAATTFSPSSAMPGPALAARLQTHVAALARSEHDTAGPHALERAAGYIESALGSAGYTIRRPAYRAGGQAARNIEVSVSGVAPGARPERIFIVGAHYAAAPGAPDILSHAPDDEGSGTAAVLELARLLKDLRPSRGTEVRFVFFMGEAMGGTRHARVRDGQAQPGLAGRPGDAGNFIAFVGTVASSKRVQEALSAFQQASDFPARGLAAPAYVQGVTLSNHAAYQRCGYPALMITDTAFMRYPYHHTAQDAPDRLDYAGMARVVSGLARTLTALAAGARA